jgi:hypothetical protein
LIDQPLDRIDEADRVLHSSMALKRASSRQREMDVKQPGVVRRAIGVDRKAPCFAACRPGATGPKVSSLVMTMSVVTSVKTVGSKNVPPRADR